MKVLYIISVMGHGRGGHFHSLNQISLALSKSIDISIVSIGPGKSEIIKSNPFYFKHLYFNGLNLFSFRSEVLDLVMMIKPDIVHCFDNNSYNVIKLINISKIKNIVINKCGGPNNKEYPKIENIVLFSKENVKWFKGNDKYDNTNIFFIPNRVNVIKSKMKDGFTKKPKNIFSFVRIGRIGFEYKKSIQNSIDLIKELKKTNKVCLFVIGVVENENIFSELTKYSENLPIYFIIDEDYTNEASRMLYLADAVIGTGRGVMEAASLGLPILTPVIGNNFPSLIREDNFDFFFSTNFSERNISLINDDEEIKFIKRMLTSNNYLDDIKKNSKANFNSFFDMEKGVNKYQDMYLEISKNNVLLPWYVDFVLKLKSIKTFYLNSIIKN